MLFGVRGDGEAVVDAFLLDQSPSGDDGVDQLVALGGERLGLKIAVTAGVDDSQLGQRLSASDVFSHRSAL